MCVYAKIPVGHPERTLKDSRGLSGALRWSTIKLCYVQLGYESKESTTIHSAAGHTWHTYENVCHSSMSHYTHVGVNEPDIGLHKNIFWYV